MGWMTTATGETTPLGLIAELGVLDDFASRDLKIAALTEFAESDRRSGLSTCCGSLARRFPN
jgi:hypothetical protein